MLSVRPAKKKIQTSAKNSNPLIFIGLNRNPKCRLPPNAQTLMRNMPRRFPKSFGFPHSFVYE